MSDKFRLGVWNAICQRCGFEYKSDQIKKEWTGLRVCRDCWDPRHAQDFVRGKSDKQAVPWSSPEGEDQFLNIGDVTRDDL